MSLGALPSALALPPLNLVPLCVAGLVLSRWRRRTGVLILLAGLAGLYLLATPAVALALLAALERDLPLTPPPGDPPRAIVILSGEMLRGADGWEPGPLTLERERTGAALARRTALPVLVTGGTAQDRSETLAAVMVRSLEGDFYTPVRWVDDRADDTWDNATFSAAILRAEGITSVYLVTHGWHMRRAVLAFNHAGLTVTAVPVRLDQPPHFTAAEWIPSPGTWVWSYNALHEWAGYAAYKYLR